MPQATEIIQDEGRGEWGIAWWGKISRAETKCARAVGIGLPERSEPEGPQGAARRRDCGGRGIED